MAGSRDRVMKAFAHQKPDRTPLFEIFQPFQKIHWDICGRTIATDEAMCWDAMAEGVAWEELFDAQVEACFAINKYFGLDMVRLPGARTRDYARPEKTGPAQWTREGIKYHQNPKTKLVVPENPSDDAGHTGKWSEKKIRERIESWDGKGKGIAEEHLTLIQRVKEKADADGLDWVFMSESAGAGTQAAQYPPFMLMWLVLEPELIHGWTRMNNATAEIVTRQMAEIGCEVFATGGDVSCDKGPFISPDHYREFILPVIQGQVRLMHELDTKAVYTSDGNHWPIKNEFFFESGIDGYKEVDKAAGMTWPRLMDEGVSEKVCIIGNIDARHIMCNGTAEEVRKEVLECLEYGQKTPGGHILHLSHSVHEDVIPENYFTVVDTYREFFGMEKLAKP